MRTVVGIFPSRPEAERGADSLRKSGLSSDHVNLLSPGSSEREIHSVPTTDTEQPGMGKAVGGVVGGVVGATGGMGLGAAAASLLVPGVGPVAAVGLAAAALLGAGGAVGGAAAGGALEEALSKGLPKDEIYLYEDALRQGHSVVIALAENNEQAEAARVLLAQAGAESLDEAREKWWVGLRPAEEAEYEDPRADFASVEAAYRRGFEAALSVETRGKKYDDVADRLRKEHGELAAEKPFQRGYARGFAYLESSEKAFALPR